MSNEENKQPDPNETGLSNDDIDAALAQATESVQEDTSDSRRLRASLRARLLPLT